MKAYYVLCLTGCTCCSSENHLRGPWRTSNEALDAAAHYSSIKLLASQYASNGLYSIYETDCEELPDGRLILDGRLVWGGFADDLEFDHLSYDPYAISGTLLC